MESCYTSCNFFNDLRIDLYHERQIGKFLDGLMKYPLSSIEFDFMVLYYLKLEKNIYDFLAEYGNLFSDSQILYLLLVDKTKECYSSKKIKIISPN